MRFDLIGIPTSLTKSRAANLNKSVQNIMRSVKRTASGDALYMLKLFHKTTDTWNHQPAFHFKVEENANGIEITVWTDDNIYRWINNGTEKRYMHMSDNFIPKTVPGWIGSIEGEGGPDHYGYPLPGIEPRRFAETIYSMRAHIAVQHIRERFNREIANSFTRII